MPTTFEINTTIAVKKLRALKIERRREDRLGMKLFPIKNVKDQLVQYERYGLIRGVQQARGINGATRPVQLPGFSSFQVSPGFYGEHITFDEQRLLTMRDVGEWHDPMTTVKLSAWASTYLAERYCNRIELNVFNTLLTGGYSATDNNGQVYHEVMYDIQKLTPAVNWDNAGSSTPLADLRGWMMSLRLGKSVDFSKGEMILNGNTLNKILGNTNAADLGGKRLLYGQTINNQKDQETFQLDNDLPRFRIYNEDYYPDTGGAVRFIPDGKVIFSGRRLDGEVGGSYVQTPTVQNENKPGEWVTVEDGRQKDSPFMKFAEGHNGVTVLEYPEAWATATVY